MPPPEPTQTSAPGRAGATLQHAIETVRMTVELSAHRGYSQARIQLSPPELGGIRIHMHETPEGLVARVSAEHGAAAQTLQQGAGELRRALESSGISLLRLDIGTASQQGGSPGQAANASDGQPRTGSNGQPTETDDAPETDSAGAADEVELPNGVTVNVLA